LRLVYQALAAVENATLGAPDFGLAARQELAETVARRTDAVTRAVTTARELAAAVRAGDAAQVKALLAAHPQLAEAHNQDELPLVMDALYRRQEEIVAALVGAGAGQDIFAAAALGNREEVEALLARWDGYANLMARDGFTPLQLACYFGHEEVAHSLIDHGADVNAVATNEQQIQPLHAAAACGSVALVRLLLAHGADPNGRQQGGHVPLHTAAANGDAAMVTALLEYGADTTAQSVAGETPLDQARKDGHETVVVLLRERAEGDAGAIATE
jgi:ankyrin repeat protein